LLNTVNANTFNTVALSGGSFRGKTLHSAPLAPANLEGLNRKASSNAPIQLSLLGGENHPVLEEIRNMDLMQTTPLEALTQLYELQQRLKRDA